MRVQPTNQPIEIITSNEYLTEDIYIDGKLIASFGRVELTSCNGRAYLNCLNDGLNVDCFLVELDGKERI